MLLFLAPLQFGARDSGLPYLGSSVRANLIARGLDCPGDLKAAGDDPFTETMNSGIITLQPHGPGPAPESVLTDTTIDPGTMGADASTLIEGQPHRFDPQNGARPKPFDLNLPTQVPGKPPQPRSQPRADLSNLQPANLMTNLMDTVVWLWSEVYVLKFAPPVPPTPTPWLPSPAQASLVYSRQRIDQLGPIQAGL